MFVSKRKTSIGNFCYYVWSKNYIKAYQIISGDIKNYAGTYKAILRKFFTGFSSNKNFFGIQSTQNVILTTFPYSSSETSESLTYRNNHFLHSSLFYYDFHKISVFRTLIVHITQRELMLKVFVKSNSDIFSVHEICFRKFTIKFSV